MLIVLALAFAALSVPWVRTNNHGWLFPIALVLYFAAITIGGVSIWISVAFWLLIAAGVVMFFLSSMWFVRLASLAAIVATIVLAVVCLGLIPRGTTATTAKTSPTTTSTVTIEDKANKVLLANGWKSGEYLLGKDVDESKDKSTTGSGAFNQRGFKNPAGATAFLKSGSKSANALLASIMDGSGGTKEEVLSDSNWIAVQSLVSFKYPGNTMFRNGVVVNAGRRNGSAGDIFMLFISPSTGKAVAVRGACANPQAFIPTPNRPEEKLEAKDPSQDPYPRGNAPTGGGRNQDPGPGKYIPPSGMEKPPATARVNPLPPVVTLPAGSKPDPTPAPAPEPLAPTPDNPIPRDSYSPAPGTQ